jgi:quinol-cytochrome oxidoreductase complex cytochrome b subunit
MASANRKFTVQGLVRGDFVKVGTLDEDTVFSWPKLLIAELAVLMGTVAVLMAVSYFFNAPLEQPVNVMHPPNPAKAPWYFLGLQEQVSYSAFWGGVGVPGLELLLLMILPYIDRGKEGVGVWFSRKRFLANTIFLTFVLVNVFLIVIGTFFRGANWQFVSPF